MISISNPKYCCGCTACASICNHDAITMKPDALGFLYPVVDMEKCTNCGLCEKVCSFNDNYDTSLNFKEPIAFGARHKDIDEVMKSRSGAVFIALSDYVLDNGGVVYGAGYTDHFRVVHKRAATKEERDEFRGSKYVQSDMNTVFRQIKKDLKDGLIVLFSGTPCQTSGLNSYVGEKLRENLYLVDIVCHGVPSPYIWRDYVNYVEDITGNKVISVEFRNKKKFGWNSHIETFSFENREHKLIPEYIKNNQGKPYYSSLFLQCLTFRYSCGICHFCNTKRPSDITIGDFWGWKKNVTDLNKDNKGLSLVFVNTKRGCDLWNYINKDLFYFPAKLENCLQPNLIKPTKLHPQRAQFEDDYSNGGFDYVFNKTYYAHNLLARVIICIINKFKKK